MQIVLHDIDYSKAFSILTSLVTNCSYSHASILQDGIIYDTTFTRGYFDLAHPLNQQGSREVTIIDIPEIDASELADGYPNLILNVCCRIFFFIHFLKFF